MRPINIYALTRVSDSGRLERLERHMSGRSRFLKIKPWETEGLRAFSEKLDTVMEKASELRFYYSFAMPRLGKEFDLLRISDNSTINIELKSGGVTEEMIKKQLLQNRYYLSVLNRPVYSYTYVSKTDCLFRLSNAGRLVGADFEELAAAIEKQSRCYEENIEELFREEQYLISPLTDPDRFLRRDYFLTAQQNDIRTQILKRIRRSALNGSVCPVQGFTGLPGTGKTLLLYDLAMELSHSDRVCVLHPGAYTRELKQLDERLKRIDFYCGDIDRLEPLYDYSVILVDEGHRIREAGLQMIKALSAKCMAPVVFTYDNEEPVAMQERQESGADLIEAIPGFVKYRLTNRIRLNGELSSFIHCILHIKGRNHRKDYPNVSVVYAGNREEMKRILNGYLSDGYIFIHDALVDDGRDMLPDREIGVNEADCKEFDRIVMLIDHSFCYDQEGYLISAVSDGGDSRVKNLFHGLNRAKHRIAVIVRENLEVFDRLLGILEK
ncbi:MAG TPA: ATP-binding protein [Lachnospiraceae bacterium]|nr:ATP-binding protein [Lachnospiraceae bacterium]